MSMGMSMTRPDTEGVPSEPVSSAGDPKSCVPCDIPPFCRNHYYRGKLLTEREFEDEQRYQMDKHRLHHVALHGWGVVCGLHVKPHPYCPDRKLVIGEGLAIDSCGREIRLGREVTIDLPLPPPPAPKPPTRTPPATTPAPQAAQPATGAADPAKPAAEATAQVRQGETGEPEHGQDEGDDCGCEPEVPARTLYLCLSYSECDAELAPAPFDDCGCNAGSSLQPNRICEGFRLELFDEKPAFWDEAVGDECEAEDCREYYWEGQDACRTPGAFCCVPLAVVLDVVPGEPVAPRQIETRDNRRRMASTETLDRVVRCILNKLPAETLTRIDDTNWEHDQRYLCREFMSEFIGSGDHQRGFRINFTDKVEAHTLTDRCFQAMVVFRPADSAEPRRIEIAPAKIQKDEGGTHWCRLVIDPAYAREHLEMHAFDLFLSLRCDQVLDHRGHAVDGDFIAHRMPTGNNIQGGLFESWIRVRPRANPA
jgi:hypothetical protein